MPSVVVDIRRFGLCLATLIAVGCSRSDEITHYRVERVDTPVAAKPAKPPARGGSPQQVLGAVFLRDSMAWFFKASGKPEAVAAVDADFQAFLKTVTFGEDGKPTWKLPDGWKQLPGNEFRIATLRLGEKDDAPEASVIGLPKSAGDDAGYLLANVNRWRTQLQLPSWKADEMQQELKTEKAGDAEFSYIVLSGTGEAGGGMTPPFAGGNRPAPPERKPTAEPPASDLKFDLPEGWKQVPPVSGITKAEFRAGEADPLKITVTVLGGPAGGLVDNINRWRGQMKLPPLAEDELLPQLKDVSVPGAEGKLVEIISTDAEPKAILGAIVVKNGMSWFIKAQGPAGVATAEKARFESFVGSLQLP